MASSARTGPRRGLEVAGKGVLARADVEGSARSCARVGGVQSAFRRRERVVGPTPRPRPHNQRQRVAREISAQRAVLSFDVTPRPRRFPLHRGACDAGRHCIRVGRPRTSAKGLDLSPRRDGVAHGRREEGGGGAEPGGPGWRARRGGREGVPRGSRLLGRGTSQASPSAPTPPAPRCAERVYARRVLLRREDVERKRTPAAPSACRARWSWSSCSSS